MYQIIMEMPMGKTGLPIGPGWRVTGTGNSAYFHEHSECTLESIHQIYLGEPRGIRGSTWSAPTLSKTVSRVRRRYST